MRSNNSTTGSLKLAPIRWEGTEGGAGGYKERVELKDFALTTLPGCKSCFLP